MREMASGETLKKSASWRTVNCGLYNIINTEDERKLVPVDEGS